MTTEQRLSEIAKEIGEEYGFTDVDAKYEEFKDFKMRWTRSYKWIRFYVTDYIRDAPDVVIEDLIRTMFEKIHGADADYGVVFKQYVISKEFLDRNRPIYIQRIEAKVGVPFVLRDGFIGIKSENTPTSASALMKVLILNVNDILESEMHRVDDAMKGRKELFGE